MSATNLLLLGVALVAIVAAMGAFTVAYRRSQEGEERRPGLSGETRRADRSMAGVRVAPPAVVEEPEPELEEETADTADTAEEVSVGIAVAETQRVVEVPTEEAGVSRRQFFNRALTASFGSFLGLFGLYSLAFLWPKLTGGFGSDVDAGLVSDLRAQLASSDGSIVPLFIPEARSYIVPAPPRLSEQFEGRDVAAEGMMALFQRCVHLGCRVPWCGPSQGFECPCHGSRYNAIGEYFGGPAPRNLDRFVVEVVGDRFIIKTGLPIETPRAPSPSVEYPQGPTCISAVADVEGEPA